MRLIDLHVDWLLQYASESVVFDPKLYDSVGNRAGQSQGYLQTTRAAIVSCFRRAADWESQTDPWAALSQLIARSEAEFPGRLLIGPDDHDRWLDDPEGLAWAMIGVEGFDSLIRTTADLPDLASLFDRGVRLFQPVYLASSVLGGSSTPGDDRGLTDLGLEFLQTLARLNPEPTGPRPIVDLAHMNPRTASDVLGWFEADSSRSSAVIPVYSHGAPVHPGFESPRALPMELVGRLRAQGGVIGIGVSPPFFSSIGEIPPAIEAVAATLFQGRAGYEGIAIGTDFLGIDQTLPGLANADEVVAWVQKTFNRPQARALLADNGARLIARAVGARAAQ